MSLANDSNYICYIQYGVIEQINTSHNTKHAAMDLVKACCLYISVGRSYQMQLAKLAIHLQKYISLIAVIY
jgi:hypothetical protein